VHYLHAEHGAKFELRHEWEVTTSFGDPESERAAAHKAAVLVDVSSLGKLECQGKWVESLEKRKVEGAVLYPLVSTQAIWIVQPQALAAATRTLEAARSAGSYLIDVSSVYASFELLGPRAPDVLSKLSSVRVEPGRHAQAPVAGVRTLVIRKDAGFQMHFFREFGPYLWEAILEDGAEFGIRPAGIDTLTIG
jgi:glycine cleavage system aminomethyltransferase T